MTTDNLANTLREIAIENWQAFRQPMLLSGLPKKLSERLDADYRQILGAVTLKKFIKDSGPAMGFRLVEHPTQRSKLGIVPTDVDFEFQIEPSIPVSDTLSYQDIQGFTRVLRSLTPDELRRMALPASLVVRLLDSK